MGVKSIMEISILHEDNHILVVEKPVNIPVQKDDTNDIDMLTLLKDDLKKRYQKPGNVYLGLVHRLDRPVGGVMVFAKTSKAASRLSDQVRTRQMEKTYLAVVHGSLKDKIGRLEDYLLKDTKTNIVKVVDENKEGAKLAVLEYEVLEESGRFSLLRVQLHTGRSHQIRVQFSNSGHPLYGDQKYGLRVNKPGQQIALWSNVIVINHPTTKERMRFASEPPQKDPWMWFQGW